VARGFAKHVNDGRTSISSDEETPNPLPDAKPDPVFKPHRGRNIDEFRVNSAPMSLFKRLLPRPAGNGEYLRFTPSASPPNELELPFMPHGEDPHCGTIEKANLDLSAPFKEAFLLLQPFEVIGRHFASG
jgi:hypothetical protein